MDPRASCMDVQELIGEVASRHGILLNPDDPTFALVTINQLVLEKVAMDLLDRVESAMADLRAFNLTQDHSMNLDSLAQKIVEQLGTDNRSAANETLDPQSIETLLSASAVCARRMHDAGERALHMADAFGKRFRWTLLTTSGLGFLAGSVFGAVGIWWIVHR